jgi:glycosyltransferase involved in cell wall biosynthesis
LVTLGADLAANSADADQVCQRLGIHEPFIVAVGTSEPRKNISRMVAAWRLARERSPHVPRLVIVGWSGWGSVSPDPDVTWFHNLATSEVRALQSAASIAAYVPLREGWGLPPIEALSFGTRVLSSSTVPSVEGRSDVVTVDPLDVDSIATGLLHALDLPVDEAARTARRESVAGLTWRAMAEQHMAVWR